MMPHAGRHDGEHMGIFAGILVGVFHDVICGFSATLFGFCKVAIKMVTSLAALEPGAGHAIFVASGRLYRHCALLHLAMILLRNVPR